MYSSLSFYFSLFTLCPITFSWPPNYQFHKPEMGSTLDPNYKDQDHIATSHL